MEFSDSFKRIRIQRWRQPTFKIRLLGLLQGFAGIADELVTIFSFGSLCSNFKISVAMYRAYLCSDSLRKSNQKQKNNGHGE